MLKTASDLLKKQGQARTLPYGIVYEYPDIAKALTPFVVIFTYLKEQDQAFRVSPYGETLLFLMDGTKIFLMGYLKTTVTQDEEI